MLEVGSRLQTAAGHKRVGDADGGGVAERRPDVELIIFLQKTPVNDVADVPLMLVPVFPGKLGSDGFKLFSQSVSAGNAEAIFQRRRHNVAVFLLIAPEVGRRGVLAAARVGHVEHIAQNRPAAAVVDEGDAGGSASHIPAHSLIPEIIFRAGGGVGPLGVDQELFAERIFIDPARRG